MAINTGSNALYDIDDLYVKKNEKGKGKISLQFSSDEELENIMDVFDKIIIVK